MDGNGVMAGSLRTRTCGSSCLTCRKTTPSDTDLKIWTNIVNEKRPALNENAALRDLES